MSARSWRNPFVPLSFKVSIVSEAEAKHCSIEQKPKPSLVASELMPKPSLVASELKLISHGFLYDFDSSLHFWLKPYFRDRFLISSSHLYSSVKLSPPACRSILAL
jgi:hypothetical protein